MNNQVGFMLNNDTNLSFFGRRVITQKGSGHILRLSSEIRGRQMADYLGAKYNPTEGYEDDICIYIKPQPFSTLAPKSYIDIVDGQSLVGWIQTVPNIPVIVISQSAYDYLKSITKNRLVLIPQHHCNYERAKRDREEVNTVGIIGLSSSFMYPFDDIQKKIEAVGMKLLTGFKCKNRLDVVNMYKQIDIQITWRTNDLPLKDALKIYNAASFGIPTVGFPEPTNKEMAGYYIPAHTIDELVSEVKRLRDDATYYKDFSEKIIAKAEDHHISKIAKLYEKL